MYTISDLNIKTKKKNIVKIIDIYLVYMTKYEHK